MSVMASRPPNMPAGAGGGGPSKRPRLSLQIKTSCLSGSSSSSGNAASTSTPNRSRGFPLNPSDPTAFNTLSNAYVTAIERASTPLASPAAAAEPLTAITTLQAISLYSPLGGRRPRPTAVSAYPATPVSALSPRRQQQQQQLRLLPSNSVMSPTPPVSAGAVEGGGGGKGRNSTVFSFSPRDAAAGRHSLEQALYAAAAVTIPASPAATIPASPAVTPPKKQQQQPARAGVSGSPPPYTHAKALRSILRNSPLSTRRSASAAATTSSPRRLTTPTVRIQQEDAQQQQQRAAKRVCYHSPIEQEITTNTYTKSHIDLLVEEATASPCSPRRMPVDLLRAFSANEIRDGGQTPGAFEDESKRMGAALRSSGDGEGNGVQKSSSSSSSTTRGEKKRRWVWTIGREDEEVDEDEEQLGGAVVAAARAAAAAAAAATTTAGGSGSGGAPLLSVPTPKRKMETDVADVEMAVMT